MRRVIKLTEGELRGLIKNCINETLSEYGDSPEGRFMLGRLAANKGSYNPDAETEIDNYAEEQFQKDPEANNIPRSTTMDGKMADDMKRIYYKSSYENGKKLQREYDEIVNELSHLMNMKEQYYDNKPDHELDRKIAILKAKANDVIRRVKDTMSDYHTYFSKNGIKQRAKDDMANARNKRKMFSFN